MRVDDGTHLLECGLGVPQLDAQHHQIDFADGACIVSRIDTRNMQRLGADDAQAVVAQGLQVLASRDEMNLGATDAQTCSEVPAQAAGAHHRNSHALLLVS